jgi:hypothetical protein
MYIQESPVDEIQDQTRWNLIGLNLTAPPPVLAPNSISRHLRLLRFHPRDEYSAF